MVCMKSDEEKEGDNTYESEGSVEEVVSVSDEKYVYDGFGELLGAEGESEVTEATGGDEVTESIEGDEVTESIEATGGDEASEMIEATGGDEVTEWIEGDELTEAIEGGEDEKEGVFDSTYEGGMSDDIREDKSFVDIIDMNDSVVPMERDYTTTFTMDDDDMTASIIGKEISLYDDVLVDSVNEMDSFHLMNEGTATDDTLNQEEMPTDWMNENRSFCDSMTEEELAAFMKLLEGNEGSEEEMLMHNEIEGYEEYWNDDMSMNAAMNEEDQLVLHENEIDWSENESAFNQYDNSWNESEVRMMIGLTSRMNRLPFPSTW